MKYSLLSLISVLYFSLFSTYCIGQWTICDGLYGSTVSSLAVNGNNIYAGIYYGGVFISTNSGAEWTQSSLTLPWVRSLAISGNIIYAGTDRSGIYKSTNNGVNWAQTSLNNKTIYALEASGNYIFAGTDSNGIYVSTNGGQNWSQTSLGNKIIYTIKVVGSYILAGTGMQGVFRSTNNGTNWTTTNLNRSVFCFTVSGSYIFAGTSSTGGVYVSTNSGVNWSQTALNNKGIRSLAADQGILFAGTDSGVYLSKNNGTNWFKKNQGFTLIPKVNSMITAGNYVFAGTEGYSVWRRLFTEIIKVVNISTEVPDKYSLSQNYPNPFNASTKIRFSIPHYSGSATENGKWKTENGLVILKVYDILGKEIATLVNENIKTGVYEVTFDGSNLISGVYFYQLKSGRFIETRKLVLIK